MGGNKRWTQDELDILKEKYGRIDIKILVKQLGRTHHSIHWKANKMGIAHEPNEVLNISERLIRIEKKIDDLHRFLTSVSHRYVLSWSDEDIQYLIDSHKSMRVMEMARNLNRTEGATRTQMHRMGLQPAKIKPPRKWTLSDRQDAYIKQNYMKMKNTAMAAELKVLVYAVTSRIKELNLPGKKRRAK